MTVRKLKGELVCTCDGDCDPARELAGGVEENFLRFVKTELKAAGWLVKKQDDAWKHYCPDCRGAREAKPERGRRKAR